MIAMCVMEDSLVNVGAKWKEVKAVTLCVSDSRRVRVGNFSKASIEELEVLKGFVSPKY